MVFLIIFEANFLFCLRHLGNSENCLEHKTKAPLLISTIYAFHPCLFYIFKEGRWQSPKEQSYFRTVSSKKDFMNLNTLNLVKFKSNFFAVLSYEFLSFTSCKYFFQNRFTESARAWIWGLFALSLRFTCSSTADADDFRRLTRCRLPEMRPRTQHRTLLMRWHSIFLKTSLQCLV